jgi:ketosteroid isomerase-like protein
MTTTMTDTTTAVLGHHVQALVSHDIEGVMADYSEESVILSPNGAITGLAGIRAFFMGAIDMLTPDAIAAMKVSAQVIEGEYALVVWSAGAVVPFAADSFHVRGGKIMMQSYAPKFD